MLIDIQMGALQMGALRTGQYVPTEKVLTSARRVGLYFAVHRTISSRPSRQRFWTLTHVPTGFAVSTILRTRASAERLGQKLLRMRKDWSSTDPRAVLGKLAARAAKAVERAQAE